MLTGNAECSLHFHIKCFSKKLVCKIKKKTSSKFIISNIKHLLWQLKLFCIQEYFYVLSTYFHSFRQFLFCSVEPWNLKLLLYLTQSLMSRRYAHLLRDYLNDVVWSLHLMSLFCIKYITCNLFFFTSKQFYSLLSLSVLKKKWSNVIARLSLVVVVEMQNFNVAHYSKNKKDWGIKSKLGILAHHDKVQFCTVMGITLKAIFLELCLFLTKIFMWNDGSDRQALIHRVVLLLI